MYYCTAAVFRDKPYMYMNGACTPFMYMYTQFMYRRESCFQGAPTDLFSLESTHNMNIMALLMRALNSVPVIPSPFPSPAAVVQSDSICVRLLSSSVLAYGYQAPPQYDVAGRERIQIPRRVRRQ
jgi:hypothetical protein